MLWLFAGWLGLITAGAIAGPSDSIDTRPFVAISKIEETCAENLAQPNNQALRLPGSVRTDRSHSSPLKIQPSHHPSSPILVGYFDSQKALIEFVEENGIAQWVKEAKAKDGASSNPSPDFVRAIGEYRDSVKYLLLHENLDQAQILKILYYNISSVSSEVIPVEWARSSPEVNRFLTDQLELLRDLLGEEIVFHYENIRKNTREKAEQAALRREFVEAFQNIISPLLQPRFGIRIVFQTCHFLYDLMLEQKYFQVAKNRIDLSLHRLLQDTLLRTGTHPYVLLYFWQKEPRLLMDQNFPADGFLFRRSGVFKNPEQSTGRLRSLTASTQSFKPGLFGWWQYDRFDPNFVLSFGPAAKYEEIHPSTGRPDNLLLHIKVNLEVNYAWEFARAFDAFKEYFLYQLKSTGPWSETLTGHASALSLFLLRAGYYERLLQFDMQVSTDISAEDFEFLEYVISRTGPLDRKKGSKPSRTRRLMLNILNFLTFPLPLPHVGTLEKQSPEPLQLEQNLADKEAASTRFETPALPNLGAALNRDIFTTDEIPSQLEIQKLGTTYKQLAHEIECIYEWVMNVEFGVGNVIDYNRSWREIVSMINPNHLDQMIKRLSHDLALLEDIQSRMTFSSADSKEKEEEEALAVEKINKIFAQSNINLIQFTKSLIEDLQVIQHTTSMHHPSNLVPANADDLKVSTEMGRISQNLRKLPALLQRSSTAHSHR